MRLSVKKEKSVSVTELRNAAAKKEEGNEREIGTTQRIKVEREEAHTTKDTEIRTHTQTQRERLRD